MGIKFIATEYQDIQISYTQDCKRPVFLSNYYAIIHKHILYFAKKVLFTAYLYFLLSRRSHSLLELLEPFDVGGLGLLRLLLENVMTLGHTPGVRLGQRGTEGPAPGRLQTLPVFSGCPGPDPGLGVHPQAPGPGNVLLAPGRRNPPLLRQLLRHGPDVVSLEPAAPADVAHSKLIRLTGELVHVKSRADSWFKSKWELWEVNKSLFAGVRCVVGQGLDEEVGGETGGVQAGLHLAHAVQGDKRVKVAIDANDVSPGPGHPDGALRGGHPVHVPLGPDTHAGPHRQRGLQTLLDSPLHLLDVLEILTQKKVKSLLDKEIDLFSEFCLHRLLGSAGEVSGALGDAAEDQSVALCR